MRSFRRGVPMLAYFPSARAVDGRSDAGGRGVRRAGGMQRASGRLTAGSGYSGATSGLPPRAQTETGRMTPRVLVVDDDTALAEMIGIVLRTEGFEPAFCADGSGALAAFRESKPDLVLLDLM